MSLLSDAHQSASRVGLNLFGIVDATRFDRSQPKDLRIGSRWPRCGTAIVLGSGGAATARQPQQVERDVATIGTVLQHGRLPFVVVTPAQRQLSFARLAEAAGLGTISPVTGLLLHPQFGPWVSVWAALLLDGQPFGQVADASLTDDFQPCCTCRQPCREVHPAASACPIGTEHRAGARWVMLEPPAARCAPVSWLQLTVRRFLPRFLRP
jgi:hypothetical protein